MRKTRAPIPRWTSLPFIQKTSSVVNPTPILMPSPSYLNDENRQNIEEFQTKGDSHRESSAAKPGSHALRGNPKSGALRRNMPGRGASKHAFRRRAAERGTMGNHTLPGFSASRELQSAFN